ncbi:hypothetical protein [Methylorubrum thiocyanatum]|uniref:hypothetical protein n=1 Tax=Methylorubrum thiocyanatum TaxID=47958 RepID=UPI00398C6FAD
MAALVSGREDRAPAAAETIASLVTERTTLRAARAAFAAEVARLCAMPPMRPGIGPPWSATDGSPSAG